MTTQQLNEKQVVWRWEPTEEDRRNTQARLYFAEYALVAETAFFNGTGLMLYVRDGDKWSAPSAETHYEAVIWKLIQERRQMQEELKWLRFGLQLGAAPNEVGKSDALPVVLTQEEAKIILSEIADNIAMYNLIGAIGSARSNERIQRVIQTAIERAKQ